MTHTSQHTKTNNVQGRINSLEGTRSDVKKIVKAVEYDTTTFNYRTSPRQFDKENNKDEELSDYQYGNYEQGGMMTVEEGD